MKTILSPTALLIVREEARIYKQKNYFAKYTTAELWEALEYLEAHPDKRTVMRRNYIKGELVLRSDGNEPHKPRSLEPTRHHPFGSELREKKFAEDWNMTCQLLRERMGYGKKKKADRRVSR